MPKKLFALLLVLVSFVPFAAMAEEIFFLPNGTWALSNDDTRQFVLRETLSLSPSQLLTASEMGLETALNALPKGTALTQEQLESLYPDPDLQELLFPALPTPDLSQFELTGEWYFEKNTLYYLHDVNYRPLIVDEVFEILATSQAGPGAGRTIYLTIDDGPSSLTMDLLATLDALDVKATFFLVGAYVREMPVFTRAIYEQGHTLANHSYTHSATILSSSFNTCLADFKRTERAVAEALGFELAMPIIRIPYGSSTVPPEYRTRLQENGYLWIDWNALNGDTEPSVNSDEDALQRAIGTGSGHQGDIVLLVHDNKKRTIRTLPALVEHFRSEGYEFRTLDFDTLEHIPGVRMGIPSR